MNQVCLYVDSPRVVEYWVQRLTSKGVSGLLDGNHPGRPTRLSVNNLADLHKNISRNPRELGYDQNLWDGLSLSAHLSQKYAISLGIRQCQRLFHQLGFSLQRPRRKASEANGPRQEALKKLLPVNARHYHSTVVRGRSPFSTPQQFNANVGSQRATTSRNLAFSPSQSWLFLSTQFENRSTRDSRYHYRDYNIGFRELANAQGSWQNVQFINCPISLIAKSIDLERKIVYFNQHTCVRELRTVVY